MSMGKAVWRYSDDKIYVAMTLGVSVSQEISRLFDAGEYGKAVEMDTNSVKAMFALVEDTEQEIKDWCQTQGLGLNQKITELPALSPQEIQVAVHEAQKENDIGVRVNAHGMLSPLKSMCMIYKVCKGCFIHKQEIPCLHCSQEHCSYKRV